MKAATKLSLRRGLCVFWRLATRVFLRKLECPPLSPAPKSGCEDSVVPPGLESFLPLFPALKRWANLARPSGAAFSCASFHQTVRNRVLTHTLRRWATLGSTSGAPFSRGIWGVIVVRGWRWTGGLPRADFVPSRKWLRLADSASRLGIVYHGDTEESG